MIRSFLISLLTLILADGIWLGVVVRSFYQRELGSLIRAEGMIWWSAGLVYLLMAVGIVFFVLPRITQNTSFGAIFLTGALFGLVLYGVYDFTNFAILKGYPLKFLVVDVLWGMFACGFTTLTVIVLSRHLKML
jgi:uncharacterized membrane protein